MKVNYIYLLITIAVTTLVILIVTNIKNYVLLQIHFVEELFMTGFNSNLLKS